MTKLTPQIRANTTNQGSIVLLIDPNHMTMQEKILTMQIKFKSLQCLYHSLQIVQCSSHNQKP